MTPWTGDQFVARPLLTEDNTNRINGDKLPWHCARSNCLYHSEFQKLIMDWNKLKNIIYKGPRLNMAANYGCVYNTGSVHVIMIQNWRKTKLQTCISGGKVIRHTSWVEPQAARFITTIRHDQPITSLSVIPYPLGGALAYGHPK
jgi:hypothetical protein